MVVLLFSEVAESQITVVCCLFYTNILFLAINLFLAVNNCLDAFPRAGIVEILNHGLDPFPVYCDQTNDEGSKKRKYSVDTD